MISGGGLFRPPCFPLLAALDTVPLGFGLQQRACTAGALCLLRNLCNTLLADAIMQWCGTTSTCLTPHPPRALFVAGLDTLDLSGNGIAILPAALSAATSLTHLTLDDNSLLWLNEAATPVLLALSRLQRLEIDNIGNADAPLLREWQLRMPRLRIVPMPV